MGLHGKMATLLKLTVIALGLFLVVSVLIASTLIASLKYDLYLLFFERLQPSFYIKTLLILLFSSLLYTPFSYGLSNFILLRERGAAHFFDLFYMFARPWMLIKGILLRISIWFVRGLYQLMILFFGVVIETIICLIYLVFSGNDIMDLSVYVLQRLIVEILRHNSFMWLTVILWICVLFILVVTGLNFMLCKYALLQYEELSVFEALQIGRLAVRGRVFALFFRLLQNYSYYIIIIGSFWTLRKALRNYKKESITSMASRWVEQGRSLYFKKKARKALDK